MSDLVKDDPRGAIASLLDELQPQSLLLVCAGTDDAVEQWRAWCLRHSHAALTVLPPACHEQLEQLGRVDCALVIGAMEQLEQRAGEHLVGRLRNIHTEHIYVLTQDDPRWPLAAWLALGLQRAEHFRTSGHDVTLYTYDLATYNRARSWNTPRYWANPENWNRFRW